MGSQQVQYSERCSIEPVGTLSDFEMHSLSVIEAALCALCENKKNCGMAIKYNMVKVKNWKGNVKK